MAEQGESTRYVGRDYVAALAFVAAWCLLAGYLDRPLEAPACRTDAGCEATLTPDEREAQHREDLAREKEARK